MKRIIITAIAMIFTAGVFAQTDPSKMEDKKMEKKMEDKKMMDDKRNCIINIIIMTMSLPSKRL